MIDYLFTHFHFIYRPAYFLYKSISDKKYLTWMKSYLRKGMVVFDIGANVGFQTQFLSKCVGNTGHVYAFEPDKKNFVFLKGNTKSLKNVTALNLAVGNKNGTISFYPSDSLNVDHQSYDSGEGRKPEKVKSVTLDDYFKNLKKVDFIKIDIEGFDYFAILGAQKIIKKQKKIALIGELWPFGLKKAGTSVRAYLDLLKKMGLKVRFLEKKEVANENGDNKYLYTNFIATK